MAHHHACKSRALQHALQPANSREVQMVRRFVQQQDIRPLHQRFRNRQSFFPAARKLRRQRIQSGKTRPPKRLREFRSVFLFRYARSFQCALNHAAHRHARRKLGYLRHAAHPRPLAYGDNPAIRFHAAVEHLDQRGFAGPIGSNNTDPFPFRNGEGKVLEKRCASVSFGKSLCANQRCQFCRLLLLCRSSSITAAAPLKILGAIRGR